MSYTQFFTSIELGDSEAVSLYINRGFDPMKQYKMDGKMTNPIKSALRRGNAEITDLLLNSRKVKVGVHDLLTASKSIDANSSLIAKLAAFTDITSIDSNDIDGSLKSLVKNNRLSSAHVNYDLTRKVLDNKIKNRCPPGDSSSDDEEDEDPEEEEEEDSTTTSSEMDSDDDVTDDE